MAYSPSQAVARAAGQASSRTTIWHNHCLGFVVWCWGIAGRYYDATTAYYHTTKRHTGTPPLGAPIWWTGGLRGHGHTAISAGGGYCYSSDFGPNGWIGDGRIRKILVSSISRYDRNLTYRGWSQDINGVTVLVLPASTVPRVDLSRLQDAARRDPAGPNGAAAYAAGTRIVQSALHAEGLLPTIPYSGSFGAATVKAYAAWQRRLGYSGSAANGIPGQISLSKLGQRHRFSVVA